MLYPDSIVSVDISAFSTEEYVTCNDLEPGTIRIFPVCAENSRLIKIMDKPVLIISPNPVRDELNFTIKGNGDLPASYIIRDMLGRESATGANESGMISVSTLATGLYTIQFCFPDGSILNYRFIKE
jgi:hypothetical protein